MSSRRVAIFLIPLPLVVLGLSAWWHASSPSQPPASIPRPKDAPAQPPPATAPIANLLDALADAARSGNEDKTARYVQSLSVLGDEALPEIRKRLSDPKLPTPVLAAYMTALLHAGNDKALPDLLDLWKGPRGTQEGLALKRPLTVAMAQHRLPAFGKALLDLWTEETDPLTRSVLAQALTTNPQGNGPLVAQALAHEKDPQRTEVLQDLLAQMEGQSHRREEARELRANPSLAALKAVLDRSGNVNKLLALSLLEKDGGREARSCLLVYARATQDVDLRCQALSAFCRKADSEDVQSVAAWYAEASQEIRRDLMNAIGQSANALFVPFAESLGDAGKRTRELLVMARHRKELGLQP